MKSALLLAAITLSLAAHADPCDATFVDQCVSDALETCDVADGVTSVENCASAGLVCGLQPCSCDAQCGLGGACQSGTCAKVRCVLSDADPRFAALCPRAGEGEGEGEGDLVGEGEGELVGEGEGELAGRCTTNADCANDGNLTACDLSTGNCAPPCASNSDCASPQFCSTGACELPEPCGAVGTAPICAFALVLFAGARRRVTASRT
jgi:hypothetical protein